MDESELLEGRRKYPPKPGCVWMCLDDKYEFWVRGVYNLDKADKLDSVEVYDVQTGKRAPGDRMDWRELEG